MVNPLSHYGSCVKDDLNKAEQKWAQRRLFSPPPRRRRGWLWLVLLLGFGVLLYRIGEGLNLPPF